MIDRKTEYAFSKYDLNLIRCALEVYIAELETVTKMPHVDYGKPFVDTLERAQALHSKAATEVMNIEERLEAYRKEKDGLNS